MKKKRALIFFVGIIILFCIAAFRLLELQIFQHKKYLKLAQENASRTTQIVAPRGIVYDTNGKVLLKNQPVFSVIISDHKLPADSEPVIRRLAEVIGTPYEEIIEKLKKKKLSYQYGNIKVATDLPLSTVTHLKEIQDQLPGVEVVCTPLRLYPYKSTGIHVLGYVGEIGQRELEQLKSKGYRLGDLIGKGGVEKTYDEYLRGVSGGEKVEVDASGRPVRHIETLEPKLGNDLVLTLDFDLQQAVEEAMKDYKGAVVVLDPRSGAVLAMASHPSYDPAEEWGKIDQKYHPFMNRALSAYPPGSVFKVVTLPAALQEQVTTASEHIFCRGTYRLGSRVARCWLGRGHGSIGPAEGLVWSCDVVFYELGKRLGPDRMHAYARKFGLGSTTGIDLPGERAGLIPSSAWKKEVLKEPWYEGDSINMGIGQGFIQVTPLQMASLYGYIATGKRFKPYVVKEIRDKNGEIIVKNEPQPMGDVPVSPEIWKLVRDSLVEVVKRGTGVAAYVPGLPAGGKTGTAENPGRPHAWFVCFAPANEPEIVISSFVEHGEHGDQAPAYVARDILKWYKENRLKRAIEEVPRGPQYISHGSVNEQYRGSSSIPTPAPAPAPRPAPDSLDDAFDDELLRMRNWESDG
ncbi:MAG: penicillin-binding protein 2 [Candidatus Margulisiibacteriota bacterium]